MIAAEAAPWQHQLDLLQTMPGIGPRVAQVILAETGGDMTRFGSAARLASWAGLAPAVYESAGRRTPAGTRHGNKWLAAMMVEAAGSVARMHDKNHLAAQYTRLAQRRGPRRALVAVAVAVAHSMLVDVYYMLLRDQPYQDLGADWLTHRNDQARTRKLVAQLERLGHAVVIDPAA